MEDINPAGIEALHAGLVKTMNDQLGSLRTKLEHQKIAEEQERLRKIQQEMENERKRKEDEERKKREEDETRRQ